MAAPELRIRSSKSDLVTEKTLRWGSGDVMAVVGGADGCCCCCGGIGGGGGGDGGCWNAAIPGMEGDARHEERGVAPNWSPAAEKRNRNCPIRAQPT